MLDIVLLRKALAQPAMLVNKATRWCLGFVEVPRPQQARVHAIGAASQLSMVLLSSIGEVLCTAADGAMCGDSLRASQSCNLCKTHWSNYELHYERKAYSKKLIVRL